jgi:hypothetical protein
MSPPSGYSDSLEDYSFGVDSLCSSLPTSSAHPQAQALWNRFHYQQTTALTREIRDLRARNRQLTDSLMRAIKNNARQTEHLSVLRNTVATIELLVRGVLGALHTLIEKIK